MSEYDAETYEKFSNSVRRQVQSLRVILDSLQVKLSPVLLFIMHRLQNSPDNRGMITLYDIRSLQNRACMNVIR